MMEINGRWRVGPLGPRVVAGTGGVAERWRGAVLHSGVFFTNRDPPHLICFSILGRASAVSVTRRCAHTAVAGVGALDI